MEDNNESLINMEEHLLSENNKWNGNICDCFNNIYPSMICSLMFPCFYISIMYHHLTKNSLIYKPIFLYLFLNIIAILVMYYSKFYGYILFYGANLYILCIANSVRTYIRIKNNIKGSNCEDNLLTIFCLPCSLSQCGRTLYSHDTLCDDLVCDSNNIL